MKRGIKIINAEYLGGYLIRITFSDLKVNTFDFESLVMSDKPDCTQFRDIDKFKKFYIENGDLIFNDNWDMLVPIADLYHKQKITFRGRPAKDNILLRVRIPKNKEQMVKEYIKNLK